MSRPLAVIVVVAVVVAFYSDGDLFRDQRRVEREMIGVAQHELQGVLSRRQVEERLGLAATEMQMLLVVRDRLVGIYWFLRVDQQVMMTGVGEIMLGGSNPHVAQTEATPERAFHGGTVLRQDDVKQGVLRCRLCLSQRRGGRQRQCRAEQGHSQQRHDVPLVLVEHGAWRHEGRERGPAQPRRCPRPEYFPTPVPRCLYLF